MRPIDFVSDTKQVTLYLAKYGQKSRWFRQARFVPQWIVKQIMLSIIYPEDENRFEDNPYFEDWDFVKENALRIFMEKGVEATKEYIIDYLQHDYNPHPE